MTEDIDDRGTYSVLTEACDQAIAVAGNIDDPIERAFALEHLVETIPEIQRRIGRARADAIRAALVNRKAVDVAGELGISRSRLYKILEG